MDSCNSSLLKLSLQIMLKVSYSICCHAGTVSKRFSEIYSGPAVSAAEGPARAALSDSSNPPPQYLTETVLPVFLFLFLLPLN